MGGVTVTYTVTSGAATLGCGLSVCSVTAAGDGLATINVTAVNTLAAVVTASLTNGSNLLAHFTGGTPPALASLTPQLSLAAGATFTWTVQALVLSGTSRPRPIRRLAGHGGLRHRRFQGSVLTNAAGIATATLTVGPLAEGQTATINACLNGTSQCVAYTAFGSRPEYAILQPVSGTTQALAPSATPAPIVLRLLDMDGNPMAGGTVALYQALYAWTPPCAAAHRLHPGRPARSPIRHRRLRPRRHRLLHPRLLPGVPTNLLGLAASGNTATAQIAIQQQPK